MTEKTDIKALRERLNDWLNSSTGYADLQKIAEDAIGKLEAERQRADDLMRARQNATYEWGEAQSNYDSAKSKICSLEAELAALKCCISNQDKAVEHWNSWADEGDKIKILPETPATAPQKPVVLPEYCPHCSYALNPEKAKSDMDAERAAIEAAGSTVIKSNT